MTRKNDSLWYELMISWADFPGMIFMVVFVYFSMFRYIIAVILALFGVFAYDAFQPKTTNFAIEYTIYQTPSAVFYFVKNPYMLLDTCYSV